MARASCIGRSVWVSMPAAVVGLVGGERVGQARGVRLSFQRPGNGLVFVLAAMGILSNGVVDVRGASAGPVRMEELIREFDADQRGVNSFYSLPWSETLCNRQETLLREWTGRLGQVDFDRLDADGKIDYVLLRSEFEQRTSRVRRDRERLAELDPLLPFRGALQTLERQRWKLEGGSPQSSAAVLNSALEQLRQVRPRVKRVETPISVTAATNASPAETNGGSAKATEKRIAVSPTLARRAAAAVDELRGVVRSWFNFYDGYQPDFGWWTRKPYADLNSGLEEYAKQLREEIAGLRGRDEDPLLGEVLGEAGLAEEIRGEFLAYSARELLGIAEQEFSWCEDEMRRAARDMGLGDDWKAALARVKDAYAPPGSQGELVQKIAQDAIRFLTERDLVTIPPLCAETWRLSMISPETQKVLPYAAYGGQHMMVAYAKDEMRHDDKLMAMRGNNRHFTRIVVPHELIPGHHLQNYVSARSRTYRQLFSTPFFVEGWALYWEMELWDRGYATSPEDRIGMLFWRMHRCARILVSLRFHLGEMTPAEMVDFLVDRVGHERSGATSEVRRFISGGYGPLYQAGYMLGGMQLRALHREAVGPGRMTDRQFNDAVLAGNTMPIEMVRAAILRQPLSRNQKPAWRFAESLIRK